MTWHRESWATYKFSSSQEGGSGWVVPESSVTEYHYNYLDNNTMLICLALEDTKVRGTPNQLWVRVPDGRLCDGTQGNAIQWFQDAHNKQGPGRIICLADGSPWLRITKIPGPPYAKWEPNNCYIFGQVIIRVKTVRVA